MSNKLAAVLLVDEANERYIVDQVEENSAFAKSLRRGDDLRAVGPEPIGEWLDRDPSERPSASSITLIRDGQLTNVYPAPPTDNSNGNPKLDVCRSGIEHPFLEDEAVPRPADDAGRAGIGPIEWGPKTAPVNMPAEVISFYDHLRREERSSRPYDPFRDDQNEIQGRVKYLHGDRP